MANSGRDTEKLKKIVSLLPGEHCGKCGFENCGKFAVALVEGNAKPVDCRKSLPMVKELCEVLGIEAPSEQELTAMGSGRGHGHHGHHGHHGKHGHHGHHGHGRGMKGAHPSGGHHARH